MENKIVITREQLTKIDEQGERIGILIERNRILDEISKMDLPLGVWPLIRNIINPEYETK